MDMLTIKNLGKFQHYKLRNPPWIKLYREFWNDYTLRSCSPAVRLLFIGLCSLAAELGNKIPADPRYLSERLGFPVASKMLAELLATESVSVSVSVSVSDGADRPDMTLASCTQDASKPLARLGKGNGHGKTAFPDPWDVTEDMQKMAEGFGFNAYALFDSFKDHALTHDRRCSDWRAAWRNWVRKEVKDRDTRKGRYA